MALNINLFVHGIPMGQKIWGKFGDDKQYIQSFYGPKWDAPELMKVDTMTFGGTTYCYYSFVVGQNVCDQQGRAGGYFALTLRINAYYADIQNVYNILKATYDKMCIGNCIQVSNGTTKFIIADFQNIDEKLKTIETRILNYISNFSNANDILSLNGIPSGNQSAHKKINLHECTKSAALDIFKQTGKLMVSPWYLSVSAANTVAKYKAEVQNTVQKAQQEIQMQKQTAQETINNLTIQNREQVEAITKQSQEQLSALKENSLQELQQLQEKCDKKIKEIKDSFAEADKTITSLKKDVKAAKEESNGLNIECKKKDRQIKNLNSKIEQLNHHINHISGGKYVPMPEPKRINWMVVGIISFFTLVLVGLLGYYVTSTINGKDKEIKELRNQIEQNNKKAKQEENKRGIKTIDENGKEVVAPTKLEIEIRELRNQDDSISSKAKYHYRLINDNEQNLEELGKWYSNDFDITEKKHEIRVKAGKTGSGTLEFKIEGKTVAKKKMHIKK